jgi:hypothetical protein
MVKQSTYMLERILKINRHRFKHPLDYKVTFFIWMYKILIMVELWMIQNQIDD